MGSVPLVLKAESPRQLEVKLDGSALMGPTEGVVEVHVNLEMWRGTDIRPSSSHCLQQPALKLRMVPGHKESHAAHRPCSFPPLHSVRGYPYSGISTPWALPLRDLHLRHTTCCHFPQ